MNVTCVTSRYLPNLRHIARLLEVDSPVVLDLAPLPHQNKNSFISRNRIMEKSGHILWLSLPIHRKGIKLIKDAKIEETNRNWIEKHIKSIAFSYPNHKNVARDFLERLRNVLETNDGTLTNINFRTLSLILEVINFNNIHILTQGSLLKTHSEQHRLDIARLLKATSYLAGHVEWEVMKQTGMIEKMEESGISVVKSPYLDPVVFPVYSTVELSCIHTICTIGPEKTHILIEKMVQTLKENK